MRKTTIAGIGVAAVVAGAMLRAAQERSRLPKATREHEWLKQLEGEWASEAEIWIEPGKSSIKAKGLESIRMVGDFWLITEIESSMKGMPYAGMLTLGYDAERGRFVGTGVDSMTSHLWPYEGSLNAHGKVLMLETEGPCPMTPGKMFKFRETLEIKNTAHKVYTSKMQVDSGEWVTAMIIHSHRRD